MCPWFQQEFKLRIFHMEITIVLVTETPNFSLIGTETSGFFCFYYVYDVTCRPIKSPSNVSKYIVSAENKKQCCFS